MRSILIGEIRDRAAKQLEASQDYLETIHASVDLFKMEKSDFIDEVDDIITVGEFYEYAAGGHIIFT